MYFNGTKIYSLLFCSFLSLSLAAKDVKPGEKQQDLRKPLCFIENKGQLIDEHSNPRNDIQYTISTPGMNLFIGNAQMHYQFKKLNGKPGPDATMNLYRMDVALVGANPQAKVEATDMQRYYENYFLTQCPNGITAHSWNKITYKDVYPNIDWVLYISDNTVEYDFDVHPGGNINDIKLQYDGATSLCIAKNGSITAETPMGTITEKKPYAYDQDGKEVASSFSLHGNMVSFNTAEHHGGLTIDPSLLWSTYLGGSGEDVATSVTTDAANDVYVAGFTTSAGLATAGVVDNAITSPGIDAFLALYDPTGVLLFFTYYGGPGTDEATAVAVDASGVYIAGFTNSVSNIVLFGSGPYQPVLAGGNDGFFVKFNTSGTSAIWENYFGGPSDDFINSIVVDGAGTLYMTGQTASSSGIATFGAYQGGLNGTQDAFIASFNSSFGTVNWATYYGGTSEENGTGIALGGGNLFVTGQTNSVTDIASAGAYQSSLAGAQNAYIAEFSTAGTRTWGTYYGGNGTDIANAIAYDNTTGNIAIIGSSNSTSGIAHGNAFQTSMAGVQDAFIVYLTSAGSPIWGTYYGGTQLEYGQSVCFDPYGNITVAGATFSSTGIAGMNSLQPNIGGDYDAFLAKINALCQPVWNTYFGGTFYDYAYAITYNSSNQIVMAGASSSVGTYGSGGIATASAQQPANAGGIYDAFITNFATDTFVVINQPYTDTLICPGGILTVSYTVYPLSATFQPGNRFSVQLSDASGSFTSPVTIGSAVANASGTLTCTIPGTVSPGTGYRLRIVASKPGFISPDDDVNITVTAFLADNTATGNTPICVGNNLALSDHPSYSVTSYNWAGPLGFTSTLQNPVVSAITTAGAGTYTVTTTHNGCPAGVDYVIVTVNHVIPPTPTASTTSTGINCAGGTLQLFANPDTTATVTYYWVGPGGFSSTMQNPTITGATTANSGTYYMQDSLAGCVSAGLASVVVSVSPVLPVSVAIVADAPYVNGARGDTICNGTLVHFTAFPTNGGSSPTYQWLTGPTTPVIGAVSGTWASSSLTDGETIYCQLISSVNCPLPALATSNGIKMNVITNAPEVYITASPSAHVPPGSRVSFSSTVYDGGINPMYQWTNNGVPIAGATNDTFSIGSVTKNDTIALIVTSTMNCSAPSTGTSNTIIAAINTGFANISAAFNNVALYPNPNNGTFTLKGQPDNMDNTVVKIEVTNLLGQTLYQESTTVQNNEINKTVSLGDLPAGVYFLTLGETGAGKVFRFTVQH